MFRREKPVDRSEDLALSAKSAWSLAIADFYHPPLPDPVIEHSDEVTSYFYINSANWTVHLNTAGVPMHLDPAAATSFLHSICHHEIQHYLVCPYDGVTNGMLFSAARRYLDDSMAMFACNIYADLVVDSALLKRFPRLTHERIKMSIHDSSLRTRDHSPIWKLIVSTYRTMWGFPIPAGVDIDSATVIAAEAITKIARESINIEGKWPKAVGKIAKIIAEWMPEDDMLASDSGSSSDTSGEGEGSGRPVQISVPLDVDSIMGSPVENRNGDLARKCLDSDSLPDKEKEMERLAIEVENRGGDLRDLESVYILAGVGGYDKDWVRFWYRAKVRGLLRFDVAEKKPSGAVPLTPITWRIGDPIEELDIVQSLQAFPVLVPNMSTRRWSKTYMMGEEIKYSLPDLLLVIDSSGSMTWSMGSSKISGDYHTALVSAFAALDYAHRRGKQIAAINFSAGTRKCRWTRERKDIERILLTYQGGGTVVPSKLITEYCNAADSNVMGIILTDAEVSNLSAFTKSVKTLTRHGHKMFIFHIGADKQSKPNATTKQLMKAGATVIPVSSVKDLPGLVVKEVKAVYGNSEG
ncbi:MAG: vWA domain-containing protein [Candidatus Thorarchaeota archaeon]